MYKNGRGGSRERANLDIVSLKQGVWGAQPPEAMGCYLILFGSKIPCNTRLECF